MCKAFDNAFNITLKLEGGLTNDVNDKGGLTKYGISQRSYPNEDIRNLTIERSKFLYERDFWKAVLCDKIKDESVACHVFDIAVNCGTGGAGKVIQKAINNIKGKNTVVVDGSIGQKTIDALNSITDIHLLNKKIAVYRARRYATICINDPKQLDFLEGWLVRTFEFVTK